MGFWVARDGDDRARQVDKGLGSESASSFYFLFFTVRTQEDSGEEKVPLNELARTNSDLLNMCKLRYGLKAKEHHEDLSSHQIGERKKTIQN